MYMLRTVYELDQFTNWPAILQTEQPVRELAFLATSLHTGLASPRTGHFWAASMQTVTFLPATHLRT